VFGTRTPKYFVYVSVEPLIIVRFNYIFFIVILMIVRTKSVIFPVLLTL
jgi:hypothetical protein